jgi:pantoate kinase
MARTPEAKVKAHIKKILQLHGVYYAMPMGTGYGNSGVPDFLCCLNGKFLAVEAKANGGLVTALQQKNLGDIQEEGGLWWIVNETNLIAFEVFIKANK